MSRILFMPFRHFSQDSDTSLKIETLLK
ncbi:uncharacterized protein METZ01_LOCUS167630, partial [marine metagenome]